MTVNQRIHDQSFCYDADLPPSVPAGEPLRRSDRPKDKPRRRRLSLLGRREPGRRA